MGWKNKLWCWKKPFLPPIFQCRNKKPVSLHKTLFSNAFSETQLFHTQLNTKKNLEKPMQNTCQTDGLLCSFFLDLPRTALFFSYSLCFLFARSMVGWFVVATSSVHIQNQIPLCRKTTNAEPSFVSTLLGLLAIRPCFKYSYRWSRYACKWDFFLTL